MLPQLRNPTTLNPFAPRRNVAFKDVLLLVGVCSFLTLTSITAFAQTASLHGMVSDPTGAVVPNATVTITDSSGVARSVLSDRDGSYSFPQPLAGSYRFQASAPDLALPGPMPVTLSGRSQTINLTLTVQAAKQNVNVEEQTGSTVSAESSSNASSIVLQGEDLESLGDSQEDLAADLQALAGPSAGPSGGALYVDGFSSGELPTKESIREVKINQNPFSPEYDKLGYGGSKSQRKLGQSNITGDLFQFW